MKCGKIVTVSHFTGDAFYKWEICGCAEGHAHKQVEVVPSYPKPTKEEPPIQFILFLFLPFLVRLSELGKPGCFLEQDQY